MELTCTASDGAIWTVYLDAELDWRWRCEVNGRIVLASHREYEDQEECIENARRPGLDADAEPERRADGTRTCRGSNGDKWEFYKEEGLNEWRWRRYERTASGKWQIVGRSSEGYHRSNFSNCLDNARRPGMDCEPDVLDQFMN